MGKVSKATKKFQSKHLKRTLDQRKKVKSHRKQLEGRRGNKGSSEELTREDQDLKRAAKEEVFSDAPLDKMFEAEPTIPKEKKNFKSKSTQLSEESSDEDLEAIEEDMENLKETDPEFYKYLKENDKDLLEFGGSKPLDDIEDENDSEVESGEDRENNVAKDADERSQIEVTQKMVKTWKNQLKESPNIKTCRNIISAFKVAVNLNNQELLQDYKYSITDEKAFHELLFLALRDLPKAIQTLAPYKIVKDARTLPSDKSVSKISALVKSHAPSLLILLNDITNTETAAMILVSVSELLPYLISFRRIIKEFIKAIVTVWSTTRDVETQLAAFAFLHNASKEYKKAVLETVLKSVYSVFIKSCRTTNARTMPLLNFQKNSASELFNIDQVLSYQIGFEYIRQLAIHLRNTLTATTKKNSSTDPSQAYKIIYNWQFCHSLDFWSRVLSLSCNPEVEKGHESPLRSLIYPWVQVTIGVIRLIPTAQFFPLRFYLIRSLIRLSQNTGVFIPVYPLLTEVLNSTAFSKPSKKSTNLSAFDFDHNIKCNQGYLGTKVYQEGLTEQFTELLGEYFALYCKNVAFPEMVTPPLIMLRRFMKTHQNVKLNKQLGVVIEQLKQNSEFIQTQRSNIDFSPSNKMEVNRFLKDMPWEKTPLGGFVSIQRQVKEAKAKLLLDSLEEEENERKEREREAETTLIEHLSGSEDDQDMAD